MKSNGLFTTLATIVGGAITVGLAGTVYLNTQANADQGVLAFTALQFVTGAFGLVALVWTFSEQRKMTEAQSRAYIEITGASYETHPGYRGATLRIGVKNVGLTPAQQVRVEGVQEYDPGAIEGKELGEKVVTAFEFEIRGDLHAQAEDVGSTSAIFAVPASEFTIEKRRPFGTDTCREARLTFRGGVHFRDAFNKSRSLPFRVETTYQLVDHATELTGARRAIYSVF
ncbi:MAG: hypothetical protein EOP84_00370 [Verrucomicrobiaceae bacterium]|nr:MAG: hypothetical protein EOP84_00370 [Verrucomicrobiaceae bacterium]